MKKELESKSAAMIVDEEYTHIPSFIFRDRSVAVLEALVEYLVDVKKLSYHEIAVILNRDDRTIWTSYKRTKIKRHAKKFKKNLLSQIKNF